VLVKDVSCVSILFIWVVVVGVGFMIFLIFLC